MVLTYQLILCHAWAQPGLCWLMVHKRACVVHTATFQQLVSQGCLNCIMLHEQKEPKSAQARGVPSAQYTCTSLQHFLPDTNMTSHDMISAGFFNVSS